MYSEVLSPAAVPYRQRRGADIGEGYGVPIPPATLEGVVQDFRRGTARQTSSRIETGSQDYV